MQALINNEVIEKIIDENIVMGEIEDSSENIWSFLLMSGYLKTIKTENIEGIYYCTLKIPNKEVDIYFRTMILKWFEESLTVLKYKTMVNALISGDIEIFSQIEDKKYETELVEKGIKNIIKLAVVFKGKEIQITKASDKDMIH